MSEAFAALWPSWPADRLLAVDDDLVVVDKPADVPAQGADSPVPDDALDRVRTLLAARATREGTRPAMPYLASHQLLERDTSGVLVFAHRRSANGSLVAQFAAGAPERVYLAAIDGLSVRAGERGELRARSRRAGTAAPALPFRVRECAGRRALIEIRPTGPAGEGQRVRALLAEAGHPVVGDVARGGAPATRVMLHLESLALEHPADRRPVRYAAPVPAALLSWVHGEECLLPADAAALSRAIALAADRRFALARSRETDAFRLVNDAGDGIAGVTIDRYGEFALVQFYTPEASTPAARARVLDAVAATGARGVYAKFRPRQSNTLVDTRRDDLAPAHALRGVDAPDEFDVHESGLRYRVRLGDGLSTGIFLDQRENRRRVRELAAGRRVLNLFAYTCPFTVAAAAGGAAATVSVDAAPGALAWARRNLEANGLFEPARHALVQSDVFGWLAGARARRDRFDLVLLDPPSYSSTKDGTRFSAESDYRALAAEVASVVAPGGSVLCCSNHRGILRVRFRRHLHEAMRLAGREPTRVRDWPDPSDFPAAPGREPHLKSVFVTLA